MKKEYKSKRKKDLYFAQRTARTIKQLTGVDVFENTRRQQVIEIRSLLVYILRSVENMTYETIKEFFNNNGKAYDHTTALHAYKNYNMDLVQCLDSFDNFYQTFDHQILI